MVMVRTVVTMGVQDADLDEARNALSPLATGWHGVIETIRPGSTGPSALWFLTLEVPGDARDEVRSQIEERTSLPYQVELREDP